MKVELKIHYESPKGRVYHLLNGQLISPDLTNKLPQAYIVPSLDFELLLPLLYLVCKVQAVHIFE